MSFLRRKHNIKAVVCQITGCDYIVSNRMGVERRLVSGFVSCTEITAWKVGRTVLYSVCLCRTRYERVSLRHKRPDIKPYKALYTIFSITSITRNLRSFSNSVTGEVAKYQKLIFGVLFRHCFLIGPGGVLLLVICYIFTCEKLLRGFTLTSLTSMPESLDFKVDERSSSSILRK